jgi:hypothetical protein
MLFISTSTDFSNCRFSTFIAVNNVSDTAFLAYILLDGSFEKKLKRRDIHVGTVVLIPAPLVAVDPYLWVLISLNFPLDLQLRSIDICFSIQWSGNGAETRENFV